jgi:hypothetical protein
MDMLQCSNLIVITRPVPANEDPVSVEWDLGLVDGQKAGGGHRSKALHWTPMAPSTAKRWMMMMMMTTRTMEAERAPTRSGG